VTVIASARFPRRGHVVSPVFGVTLFLWLTFPCVANSGETAQPVVASQSAAASARQYKQAGDQYVAANDFDKAADAYITALDLARETFTADERVRMAIYLSWADRLTRAKEELNAVLATNPDNVDARVQLGRVLSWNGELKQAIDEAEKVLKQAPDNREALQVKADTLQWKGELRQAIPIYQRLVQMQDDFDSRIGLSQSLLAAGNRTGADETSRLLQPATANQRNRFTKFQDTLEAMTRPKLDFRYVYYSDSDHNVVDRYSVAPSLWLGNYDLSGNFRHTEARDPTRREQAEELGLRAYSNFTEAFAGGAALGFTRLGRGDESNFPTGGLKFDVKIPGGTVGGGVAHEVLTDSAELIQNRIRTTIAGLQWSHQWTDRFSVSTAYKYRSFSDVNHAHDAQFTSQYTLFFNPRISVGYRFRYLNYARQSGGGYFDPNDYYSNRLLVSSYIERQMFYAFVDIFGGQQAFRRNGFPSSDPVFGGSASFGFKPTRYVSFELSVEGSNLAIGTSTGVGFNYFVLSPRILFRF
jgi:tetratricopeptide (TPR) repeat protein